MERDHAERWDFGVSLRLQRPVSTSLAERMPATLELVFVLIGTLGQLLVSSCED